MHTQGLIKLLPFLAALSTAAPVNGKHHQQHSLFTSTDLTQPTGPSTIAKRQEISKYCTVVPQTASTLATIDCQVPDLTDADIDNLYANLDPTHCTRTASGIECSLLSSATKRSITSPSGALIALPIVIGSGPAALSKRQTLNTGTVTIPKDLIIGSQLDKGTVIGAIGGGTGSPVATEVKDVKYGYGGFKFGKPGEFLEQVGTPVVIKEGINGGVVKPVIKPGFSP